MELPQYLAILRHAEQDLAAGLRHIAHQHAAEVDIHDIAVLLAGQCDEHVRVLQPFFERYGDPEAARHLDTVRFPSPDAGALRLLLDLHTVYLLACSCDISWTIVGQAARAARDDALTTAVNTCHAETTRHLRWLTTRLKTAAPQALVVA